MPTTRRPFSRLSLLSSLVATLALAGCAAPSSLPADARSVHEVLSARSAPPELARLAGGAIASQKPPKRPLTEADIGPLAIANNREVWAALNEVGIARGMAEQAGLLPNPEMEIEVWSPADDPSPRVSLGLEMNISEALLTSQRRSVADARLLAEQARVAGEVLDLVYAARVAFYEAQAAQQKRDLFARLLASFEAGHTAAEELFRVGNLPEIDLVARRAALEEARIAAAESDLRLVEARERLNVALGLSGESTEWTAAELAGPVEEPSRDTSETEALVLRRSLELTEIAHQTEAASRRAGLSRTEGLLPHIEGGLHAEQGEEDAWELGARVTVGLPIFDRGQGSEAAARAEVRMLRDRYASTSVTLRAATRAAMSRLSSTATRARFYRDSLLPARKQALAETVLYYNAMQVGVFRVLDAERAVTEASIGYVTALQEHHEARAGFEQLLAGSRSGATGAAAGAGRARSEQAESDAH